MAESSAETDLITYFVNGEREQTGNRRLTVRTILADAGFTPVENYQLQRDAGHHTFASYDEEVPLHEDERFTVLYKGPTPTS